MSVWDDPETASYYESFCQMHPRYRRANTILISHAHIEPGHRVLDVAAGTGRTAEAALSRLGDRGRVLCVEPAAAMRALGMRRLHGPQVQWSASLLESEACFDRVLCGAAIWQLEPVHETLNVLAGLLRKGGALCFNIPALYLLEPDEPGGGSDPLLLSLPKLLFSSRDSEAAPEAPRSSAGQALEAGSISGGLRSAGLRVQSWTFRLRLTQEAYASWLKIPVVSDGMFRGLKPDQRARRIDQALNLVDRSAWKWERWRGWTAWKP